MIKYNTESQYRNNIDKLTSLIKNDTYKNILSQNRTLDSSRHNTTMNTVYERLEDYYENLRILEEVKNYAKAYIETNIMKRASECRSLLSELSKIRDFGKKDGYETINVGTNMGRGVFTDRDGTPLSKADTYNSKITISGKTITDIDINSIDVEYVESVPYNNNSINSLNKGKPYRSFYFLDTIIFNGLRERIKIKLDTEVTINYIKLKESNCLIENIIFIDSSGNEINDSSGNFIKSDRRVSEIIVEVKCENYDKKEYRHDESRASEDFWEKVKDNQLSIYNNEEPLNDLSLYDGLNTLESEYDSYISNYEEWFKKKKEVKEKNDEIRLAYEQKVKLYNDQAKRYNRERENIEETNQRIRLSNKRKEQEYKANLIKIESYNEIAKADNERKIAEYEENLRKAESENSKILESNKTKEEMYLEELERIKNTNQILSEENRRNIEFYQREMQRIKETNEKIKRENRQQEIDYMNNVRLINSENRRREQENEQLRRLYEQELRKSTEKNQYLSQQQQKNNSLYNQIFNIIDHVDLNKIDKKWFNQKIDSSNYEAFLRELERNR